LEPPPIHRGDTAVILSRRYLYLKSALNYAPIIDAIGATIGNGDRRSNGIEALHIHLSTYKMYDNVRDTLAFRQVVKLLCLLTIRSSAELNSFGRVQGITVNLGSNDPEYSMRCGPMHDGQTCPKAQVYCNEVNGWCGNSDMHRQGSTGAFDFRESSDSLTISPVRIDSMTESLEFGHLYPFIRSVSPELRFVRAHLGQYDGCGKSEPMVWLNFAGHLRSFEKKLPNFLSFIGAHPCVFVSLFTWDVLEAPGPAWWSKNRQSGLDLTSTSVPELLEKISNSTIKTNFAWLVMHQGEPPDEASAPLRFFPAVAFSGSLALSEAAAAAHGIKVQDSDIILQSRPDLLFSHTLDFQPLIGLGKKFGDRQRNFVLLVRHDGTSAQGKDPSELFVVATRGFWAQTFHGTLVRKSHMPWGFDFEVPKGVLAYSTVSKYIGYQGRIWGYMFVHAATCMGVSVYYISSRLKIHILRMSGSYKTFLNHDEAHRAVVEVNSSIKGSMVLDITKDAVCVFGRSFIFDSPSFIHGRPEPGPERNGTERDRGSTCSAHAGYVPPQNRQHTKQTSDAPMSKKPKQGGEWAPGLTTHDFAHVCTVKQDL
jgi:hypothetical protein